MLFRIWRFVRRLSSHLLHRRFSAFFGELASLVRRPLASVRALRYTRQLRRTLGGLARGRRVIIFPPTLDWHLPLYQRPELVLACRDWGIGLFRRLEEEGSYYNYADGRTYTFVYFEIPWYGLDDGDHYEHGVIIDQSHWEREIVPERFLPLPED